VLGAGPSGLAVAKALGERGIPYAQVESTDHVGGNWAHGVYSTAHIISSRRIIEYTDHPMPSDWPDFPSADQMRRYYEDYTDSYDLRRHIRFDTEVSSVVPLPDGSWQVTMRDGTGEVFKGVAVCNGHHWDKVLPPWAAAFAGELIHSKDYKHPDQLRGKRVLVLGGGNSGCDIVSEAARVGAAHWSLRRGYWFMPKTLLGRPTVELMRPWMPLAAQRVMVRAALRLVIGRYSDYGLPTPDHRLFQAHPTVSTEVFHYLKHGRITVQPDVSHVEGDMVHFTDGTSDRYDQIVCATGYATSFPFLPVGIVPVVGKTPQVVGGMLVPGQRNLFIVGAFQARYGIGPLIRPAAELLAHWVGLQNELDTPLSSLLTRLGAKPPRDHLMDPHQALANMRRAPMWDPLIRWTDRRHSRRTTDGTPANAA
jgi:hypothetical protein